MENLPIKFALCLKTALPMFSQACSTSIIFLSKYAIFIINFMIYIFLLQIFVIAIHVLFPPFFWAGSRLVQANASVMVRNTSQFVCWDLFGRKYQTMVKFGIYLGERNYFGV